jgi:hypothetical protein
VPTALAEAMDFQKSEPVEWIVSDRANLIVHRNQVEPTPVEKKTPEGC